MKRECVVLNTLNKSITDNPRIIFPSEPVFSFPMMRLFEEYFSHHILKKSTRESLSYDYLKAILDLGYDKENVWEINPIINSFCRFRIPNMTRQEFERYRIPSEGIKPWTLEMLRLQTQQNTEYKLSRNLQIFNSTLEVNEAEIEGDEHFKVIYSTLRRPDGRPMGKKQTFGFSYDDGDQIKGQFSFRRVSFREGHPLYSVESNGDLSSLLRFKPVSKRDETPEEIFNFDNLHEELGDPVLDFLGRLERRIEFEGDKNKTK